MNQQGKSQLSMLAVGPSTDDRRVLTDIFSSLLKLHTVSTCREAREVLASRSIPVVITDRDLSDGSWRDVLSAIATSGHASNLIVASHQADECLWADVLHMGGFDVLATPFDRIEVSRTVDAALRDRLRHKPRTAIASK